MVSHSAGVMTSAMSGSLTASVVENSCARRHTWQSAAAASTDVTEPSSNQ